METNDALSTVSLIASGVKDAKAILDTIPTGMFLPPNRNKIIKLQQQVTLLESQINIGFPKLARLIRSYSSILSDVKVLKIISDKVSEILETVQTINDYDSRYVIIFLNQIESGHGRLGTGISELPEINNIERGKLDRELGIIRDIIRDLKREISQRDCKATKNSFYQLSTIYTDIEISVSLVLKKILEGIELKGDC